MIERYGADRSSLVRMFSSASSGSQSESRAARPVNLIELSPNARARMREFYGSWVARLDDVQFDAMSQEGRIDFLLFKNHLLHELKQLDLQEKTMEGEAALLPFARAIVSLEEARRRMDPVNPSKPAVKESFNRLTAAKAWRHHREKDRRQPRRSHHWRFEKGPKSLV